MNGVKIGESENMYIAHEFRVDEFLKDGENTLTVHLRSALLYGQKQEFALHQLIFGGRPELRHLRKAPHSGGWDIMCRAMTAGLWREVRLEVRDEIRFSEAYFQINHAWKYYCFFYMLESDSLDFDGVELEIDFACGEDSHFTKRVSVKKRVGGIYCINIPNPKLWWPVGYGEANMYDGTAKIYKNGELIHTREMSFGIRDVKLEREDPLEDIKRINGELEIFSPELATRPQILAANKCDVGYDEKVLEKRESVCPQFQRRAYHRSIAAGGR